MPTFSFTGLAYLLAFFAVGLLTYRFFQYWQKEKNTTSKLFCFFAGFFAFNMLTIALPSLFFANNLEVLRWVVISSAFIQIFPIAILGYLLIYQKFPKIYPLVGFAVIFLLGLGSVILTIVIPFQPYLESGGGINWNIQPLPNTIRSLIFLITFLPMIVIMAKQAKTSEDPFVKMKALGLGIGIAFGAVTALFDFLLEPTFNLSAISSDIAMVIVSVVVIMTILFTQQVSSPKKEEKYTPPSSQIQW